MPRGRRIVPVGAALSACALAALTSSGARAETVLGCASGALAIPDDGSELVVPIEVAGAGTVDAITVDLDVTHPWVGDLVVSLTDGTTSVVLLSRVALGTYPFGCGGDNIGATFSDGAATPPADLCSPATVPTIGGLVLPDEALAAFVGSPIDAPWELRIRDEGPFDSGTLDGVCLTIEATPPPPACTADLDGDQDVDVFDFAIFASNFGQPVTPGTGGDYDTSGSVDVFDFSTFAGQFGCTSP